MNRLFKYLILAALLAIGSAQVAWAQDKPKDMAQPAQAERRIYSSPKGELFMHPDQPLYLWVSGSPNGPKMRIQTKADWIAKLKGERNEAPPFKFTDGSGRHTLVHPNGEGHFWSRGRKLETLDDGDIFYFHLDGKAPKSWPSSKGAAKAMGPKGRYYGAPVSIALKAQDQGHPPKSNYSGVAQVYYSIDGAAFQPYSAPLRFDQERRYDLRYYAVDQVGNQEQLNQFEFHLDLTAPSSSSRIKGPESGRFVAPGSRLVFSGSDSGVGLASVRYRITGPQSLSGRYSGPVSLKRLKEGEYQVSYWATDKVRNQQPKASTGFIMDRSAPRLALEAQGDGARRGRTLYVSQRSKLELRAADSGAGVSWVKFKLGQKTERYAQAFAPPKKAGTYTLKAWARDKVGNQTRALSFKVVQDPVPPDTSYAFEGPHSIDTKGRFLSPKGSLRLSAKDKASGVAEIFYQVDGAPAQSYQGPIKGLSGGEHQLTYYAKDRVNNQEREQRLTFFVDDLPPELATRFSTGSMGAETYPQGSLLFLMGTDQASGLKRIQYRLDGGQKVTYDQPLRLDRPGRYRLEVWAQDKVGNGTNKEITFTVR